GRGKPLPERQAGPGGAAVEDVVPGLRPPRKATDAAELAERPESLVAAGQELVRIRLVAGVPDDPVDRRVEEPVECDRQLDDAEAAAEVAAGRRDRGDDRLADLGSEAVELVCREGPQVGGAGGGGAERGGAG